MSATLPVTVTPVKKGSEMRRFIRLPRLLYRGLPGFVPPLDLERRGLLHPKAASFFQHGRAQYFLAWRGRACVGRISAQVDPVAIERWGERIGLFGALDAIDDPAVVASLLAAAAAWLRAENMTAMRGPYTPSPNGESGLMISGQHERPMLLSPWHPPYLAAHVEAAGLGRARDLYAYDLAIGPEAEAAHAVTRVRLSAKERGLSVRELRPKELAADAAIIGRLYNDAWDENWGFVPITDADVKALVRELKPVIRPEHLVMVERDGEPVGFALVLPNIYDIVGDLGGSPSPLGWARLATRLLRFRFRSGRVILLGISRTLRGTTTGALMPSLIIAELMRRGRTMPFRHVELGWILEDNRPMRRIIERLSPTPSKVWRLYERPLA